MCKNITLHNMTYYYYQPGNYRNFRFLRIWTLLEFLVDKISLSIFYNNARSK